MLFASRDAGLQRKTQERIGRAMKRVSDLKAQAVSRGDEPGANLMLGFECVFRCLAEELEMWIQLKAGEADKAWDALIHAEDAAVGAARAHPGFAHLPEHLKRLEALERLVFPGQVFVSSGFIVRRQVCTICEQDYDDCGHIAGQPYWGEFCTIRQEEISLDHVSLVEDPASKLCRITHSGEGASRQNRMTGLPDPGEDRNFNARIV